MFGTMPSAIAGASWSWSGTFPYPADTAAELYEYLGVDGSVSPAIGSNSHLWNATSITSDTDVGTLATASFDLSQTGTPTIVQDSDFGLGVRDCINHDTYTEQMHAVAGAGQIIPSAKDGTKSFLIGGIMKIDAMPSADLNAYILHQFNVSTLRGWQMYTQNAGGNARQLRFRTWQNGTTVHDSLSPGAFVLGEPFCFLGNIDVQAGLTKCLIYTPAAGPSYHEAAWADIGDFNSGTDELRIGDHAGANLSGFEGTWAQMFTLEYSSSLDAELSIDNIVNFVQYCDGFKTV